MDSRPTAKQPLSGKSQMPTTTPNDERRRETRYTVAKARSIRIAVRRTVEDREETLKGTLIDLSQGGAKLLVPVSLQFSETVKLKMTIPNLDLTIDVNSEVCWIRPAEDNQWLVGCSFTPKISEDALAQLAAEGIVERRSQPRHSVEMLATACWESEREPFPVVLRDYSANGFCMSSIQPGKVGQGVSIDLNTLGESDRDITGKVRWQIEWKGEYLIGCMMNGDDDFERLCEVGHLSADGHESLWSNLKGRVPAQYRRFSLLTASWIAIFVSCMLLGMSVPVFCYLTSDDAEAGASRTTTASLAERRAAADKLLASEPLVSTRRVETPRVAEHKLPQDSRMPSADATLPPPRTEIQPADSDLPTRETSDLLPVDPTPEAPRPVTVGPSASVLARELESALDRELESALDRELENEKDHVEAPVSQSRSTSHDFALSTTEASAEDVSTPAIVTNPNESEVAPSSRELEAASRNIQSLLQAIVGNNPQANNTPRNRPREIAAQTNRDAGKSEIAAQTNRDAGNTNRFAQVPRNRHPNPTVNANHAREAWQRGSQLYRAGQFPKSCEAFRDAVRHDPLNPLYRYLLAMSSYQMRQFDEANEMLKLAIQLERSRPIATWGSLMSRYQGHPRLWVEQNRSAARK